MRFRLRPFLAAVLGTLLLPTPAIAECKVTKYLEIPVTMVGRKPIAATQINGRDARLILDSGAFFSTLSQAAAQEYGLHIRMLGNGTARLKGIGGDTSLNVATAKTFTVAGQTIPNIEFAIGGSDFGYAGLLGQNILGLVDVEYDLPHGTVRLMKGDGCKSANMAYWAGTKPFTIVQLESMTSDRHTVGTIHIDGKPIRAVFDTGAGNTILTLAAAKRLGMTPDNPAMKVDGYATGVGTKRASAWRARFASIDIGGEAIAKPFVEVADQAIGNDDMLVGIDFFLTHRIYVDNHLHRMFVTYEGGPLFGLTPKGAVDDKGVRLDLTDKAGDPTTALGYSQRGALAASNRDFDKAIADFDKAVAMEPGNARYVYQRSLARLGNHQPLLASADLDKAIAIAPDDAELRLARVQLRLSRRDRADALADLKAVDAALAPSSDMRFRLAAAYDSADDYGAAVANYDQWLKSHPEDVARAAAFNGRCWARALLNDSLDKALSDCNAALRLQPKTAAYLDSRALVQLRRGEWAKALGDYDAAVEAAPRNAWSLYARSLVERHLGKTDAADSDKARALAINPRVEERAKRIGIAG